MARSEQVFWAIIGAIAGALAISKYLGQDYSLVGAIAGALIGWFLGGRV